MFQVSFNGDLKRSPPQLSVPSISWTVEQHDNPGYQEELQGPGLSSPVPRLETEVEAVKRELECPVCLTEMTGGIMQCRQGHCLCSPCVAQGLHLCPLCRDNIQGRAVNMENIARIIFNTTQSPQFSALDTGNM